MIDRLIDGNKIAISTQNELANPIEIMLVVYINVSPNRHAW